MQEISIAIVAVAIAWAGVAIARELKLLRRELTAARLMGLFAPGVAAAGEDPRALTAWYPYASSARQLFPDAFRELDAACGGTFPFTVEQVKAAHARWSADWLAWERSHDAEYKIRAAALEDELTRGGLIDSPVGRARLDAVERAKLELYQQRYAEYVRISKALAALIERDAQGRVPEAGGRRPAARGPGPEARGPI